jgi:hypothetical protein
MVAGVVAGTLLGQAYSLVTRGGFLLAHFSQQPEWLQLSYLFIMGAAFLIMGLGVVFVVIRATLDR